MAHENAVAGTGVWNDKRIDRRTGAVADCPVGLAVFVRDGGMGWVRVRGKRMGKKTGQPQTGAKNGTVYAG